MALSQKDIKDAFKMFDKNNSGTISSNELGAAIIALGLPSSDDEIKEMIKRVDKDENGVLDFDEFAKFVNAATSQDDKELRQAFNAFDQDGSGHITKVELKQAMKEMGAKLADKEIDEMIAAADTDKDGKVDFDEFKKMMAPK